MQSCSYSSSSEPDLKDTFKKVLPAKRELLKKVKAHADKELGVVKVENTLGGMRYAGLLVGSGLSLTYLKRIEGHGMGGLSA